MMRIYITARHADKRYGFNYPGLAGKGGLRVIYEINSIVKFTDGITYRVTMAQPHNDIFIVIDEINNELAVRGVFERPFKAQLKTRRLESLPFKPLLDQALSRIRSGTIDGERSYVA